ncbi:hypothetical protein [Iodidimonas nitroreducens]|uniref:hypothetical protein n=1 Tax=Iodidimonas nitroreducens TaxID=1236968 RepID=UPI001268C5BB|nr:hypothetical protein [Iodidimonas nitroreducens]
MRTTLSSSKINRQNLQAKLSGKIITDLVAMQRCWTPADGLCHAAISIIAGVFALQIGVKITIKLSIQARDREQQEYREQSFCKI